MIYMYNMYIQQNEPEYFFFISINYSIYYIVYGIAFYRTIYDINENRQTKTRITVKYQH